MKIVRIFICCAALAASLPFAAATVVADGAKTERQQSPAVAFKEMSYSFGVIPEDGGPVSHFFEFTNTGNAPLVIISATASCGCTRPTYPTEPIAPGKSGKIKVTYLPEGRPGEFSKTVKVRTNAAQSRKITLKINGTVVPK